MNKVLKISLIIIVIIVFTLAVFVGYLKLKQLKSSRLTKESRIIWAEAQEKAVNSNPFHYQIIIVGKENNKESYRQTINGDWAKERETKGSYKFKNKALLIEKDFVILGDITYSNEGLEKRWFIWQTKDFPEGIYYTPESLVQGAKNIRFTKKEKGLWLFEGIIEKPIRSDDGGMNPITLHINQDGQLAKATLKGVNGKIQITKVIEYSNYGIRVMVEKPKMN